MGISVFETAIAPLSRMLLNPDRIVSLAGEYARDKNIDPAALIQARLYPDMLPFVSHIRTATDNFYFHVTTAYDILRHNGLPMGKRDCLGVPR